MSLPHLRKPARSKSAFLLRRCAALTACGLTPFAPIHPEKVMGFFHLSQCFCEGNFKYRGAVGITSSIRSLKHVRKFVFDHNAEE